MPVYPGALRIADNPEAAAYAATSRCCFFRTDQMNPSHQKCISAHTISTAKAALLKVAINTSARPMGASRKAATGISIGLWIYVAYATIASSRFTEFHTRAKY